jgi:hypothetical protein
MPSTSTSAEETISEITGWASASSPIVTMFSGVLMDSAERPMASATEVSPSPCSSSQAVAAARYSSVPPNAQRASTAA